MNFTMQNNKRKKPPSPVSTEGKFVYQVMDDYSIPPRNEYIPGETVLPSQPHKDAVLLNMKTKMHPKSMYTCWWFSFESTTFDGKLLMSQVYEDKIQDIQKLTYVKSGIKIQGYVKHLRSRDIAWTTATLTFGLRGESLKNAILYPRLGKEALTLPNNPMNFFACGPIAKARSPNLHPRRKGNDDLLREAVEIFPHDKASAHKYIRDRAPFYASTKERAIQKFLDEEITPEHRRHKREHFRLQFIPMEELKKRVILLWGKTCLGKTAWAEAHLEKPKTVKLIERLTGLCNHDGFVLDEISFDGWQAEEVLAISDMECEAEKKVRYQNVVIPAGMPRFFTSQHNLPGLLKNVKNLTDDQRDALATRFIEIHVTEPTFHEKYRQSGRGDPVTLFGKTQTKPTTAAWSGEIKVLSPNERNASFEELAAGHTPTRTIRVCGMPPPAQHVQNMTTANSNHPQTTISANSSHTSTSSTQRARNEKGYYGTLDYETDSATNHGDSSNNVPSRHDVGETNQPACITNDGFSPEPSGQNANTANDNLLAAVDIDMMNQSYSNQSSNSEQFSINTSRGARDRNNSRRRIYFHPPATSTPRGPRANFFVAPEMDVTCSSAPQNRSQYDGSSSPNYVPDSSFDASEQSDSDSG